LSNRLACQVLFVNSKNGEGIEELKKAIENNSFFVTNTFCRSLYDNQKENEISNDYKQKIEQNLRFKEWEKDFQRRKQIVNSILSDTIG
jgi:Fe2+ transport system protein B